MNITKVLYIERPRLGNGAAAMLSFIDARQNNLSKRISKRAELRIGSFPRRPVAVLQKDQGKA